MDEKITDIRFNPIKFHPKKKLQQFRATKEGRKKRRKEKEQCQPFGPRSPRKNLISIDLSIHPSTVSRRCNEIIFSFARPSLRFFCAGFLLNAGHKIVGYGRTITQATSWRRRANIECNRETCKGAKAKGKEKETEESCGRGDKERRREKGSVNEMSFGRIKVAAQVPIPFFQFFQPGRISAACVHEARKKSAGYKSPRAPRPFSKTLKGVQLEEKTLARAVVAPISCARTCCARLADDN